MTSDKLELTSDPAEGENGDEGSKKYPWYWAPVYCAVWYLLFYVAVIPSYYSYPEKLLIRNEANHPDEFIGERAELQLLGLAGIGPKLTGSVENEVVAVQYLLNEIEKIKANARTDLYDIEVDVGWFSGHFMLWGMACAYRNVTNIMVKISPKNVQSESYLLVNSHFDSEVLSPAAADAGVMIVVMLETLRVISRSEKPLNNPVVFLLNGAEEANLLASHGFITQHRWAKNCKAVINLDSAGAGGREVLFQSGPNHPWLMKHYKKSAKHPFANTVAEELFQNNFIPSDSDFRIFRDYGHVPGVDMAHTLNGYSYHTKYDNFKKLERGTYQNTGDNVLALTWELANAEELRNTSAHEKDHVIFYDYLGWFMVFYTESEGIAINIVVCISALIAIGLSVFTMGRRKFSDGQKETWLRFLVIFLVQILSIVVGFGLSLLIAVIMPALGLSQSWYSQEWMSFGLYYCPMFFGLTMVPAFYIKWTKSKTSMSLDDTISCFMHSHCIVLVFICLLLTGLSIRSSCFTVVAVFFYAISVLLILGSRLLFKKCDLFIPIHLLCQILPFWFYTFLHFTFMKTFIPMTGRDGPTSKPELLICGFTGIMGLHFAAFILPILQKFRKPKTFSAIFAVLAIVFIIIAATPAGFPYIADQSPQRYYVLHVHRTIHAPNGSLEANESGIYVQPVDTRLNTLEDTTFKDSLPQSWTNEQCSKYSYCGLPLYSSRWLEWKDSAKWIPSVKPNIIVPTELNLTSRTAITRNKVRLDFSMNTGDRAVIYVQPLNDYKVANWTFDVTPIIENYKSPYFLYYADSMVEAPLDFFIEIESETEIKDDEILLNLGIGAHFLYHQNTYKPEFNEFLKTFPDWAYPTHWSATFDSWYF